MKRWIGGAKVQYMNAHVRSVRKSVMRETKKNPPLVASLFMLFQPFAWRTVFGISCFRSSDIVFCDLFFLNFHVNYFNGSVTTGDLWSIARSPHYSQ